VISGLRDHVKLNIDTTRYTQKS